MGITREGLLLIDVFGIEPGQFFLLKRRRFHVGRMFQRINWTSKKKRKKNMFYDFFNGFSSGENPVVIVKTDSSIEPHP